MRFDGISSWRGVDRFTFFDFSSFPYTRSKVHKVAFAVLCMAAIVSIPFIKRFVCHTWTVLKSSFFNHPSLVVGDIESLPCPSFLSRLQNAYRFFENNFDDPQTVWILTTLQVFKEAYVEEGCHPCVRWEGTSDNAYDSLSVALKDSSFVFREDCLNNQQVRVEALSFKHNLRNLDQLEYETLIDACSLSEDDHLDKPIYEVLTSLRAAAFAIQERYGAQMNGSCSIKELIHKNMQSLFVQKIAQIDDDLECLQKSEFIDSVCQEVIESLLKGAQIDGNALIISSEHIFFKPKTMSLPKELHDFIHVTSFFVNDLNSKNMLEDPFITDEALILAKFLQSSNKNMKECEAFKPFMLFFRKNYYDCFCSQLMRKKALGDKKVTFPLKLHRPLPSIQNDSSGDLFMAYLNQSFTSQKTWPLTGSCVLAALMPEYAEGGWKTIPQGQKKAREIRAQIATILSDSVEEYMPFVTVIPGFSHMELQVQADLKRVNWVVVEEDSDEAKRAAILERSQDLLEDLVYLMEPEIIIVAKIFNRPLWIYKKLAATFKVNKEGRIQPHVIYGEEIKEKPVHLLDDNEHYTPLLP